MSTYGYLAHYGVQGMKWGVRNYQNADGTLTSAGRQRYGVKDRNRATTLGYMSDRARIRNRVTADTFREHAKGLHINKNYRPIVGGFKGERLLQSTNSGTKALKEAYKNLDAKYDAKFGKGTSQKLAKKATAVKAGSALAATAITAIATTALASTIHQQMTGKSYVQEISKSISMNRMRRNGTLDDLNAYLAKNLKTN